MLLPSGNPFESHEEILYLQPMIPPKRFDIFSLDWGMLRGLGAFSYFFKKIVPIMYSMVAPARTVHLYLFCTITRASVSVHVRISAEYLYSSEHALW